MPNARYFMSLGGSFLLGLAVVIIAVIVTYLVFIFAGPYIGDLFFSLAPWIVGIALVIIVFIIIVIAIYLITMLGVIIQYFFKPMKISKEAKGYNIATIKESGLREKGETKPIKKPAPKPVTMKNLKKAKKKQKRK
jgi:hypothetical protein